jgi:hypothetical protein
MTHEEEKLVLKWLRSRGRMDEAPRDGRSTIQRALRGGEDISREIRNAMADWLEDDPDSLLPSRGRDMKVTFRNDVELGSWNDRQWEQWNEERGARLQARINDNPEVQAFIARYRGR